MMSRLRVWLVAAVMAVPLILAGCNNRGGPGPQAQRPEAPAVSVPSKSDEQHAHKPGAHGGNIVPIGRDNYHAEAVFETGGVLRLYPLGQDEAKVLEIEAQPLTAYVKPQGGAEAVSFVLRPEPQPGDKPDMSSQFVGRLPRELWGKPVEVTIPTLRIGGERFRVGFSSAPAAHADADMPNKVAGADERQLYLTAGGKYTAADITANGGLTASQKFKGVQAAHDLNPKPGDKICPVTLTKANPKFSWVIGGKTYEFCCPPCVDEFLQLAKEKPDEVKAPEEYRKK
jgi:YHS domain-containing protein